MTDFTDCQAAATDAASFDWLAVDWLAADWLAGRCDAGMAMTRSVAMLAATATAIENLIAWLTSARRPDLSRSTEGGSTGVDCIASCMAWATALVNISERRAGLSGGSSAVVRERRSSV